MLGLAMSPGALADDAPPCWRCSMPRRGGPRPLATRRNVLEDVLDGQDLVLPVRRLADDSLKAWQQVIERGYEGLVAKDSASQYRAGRTLAWLKVKQRDYRVEQRGWHRG
jgi:ATP-dependent DNA ligase